MSTLKTNADGKIVMSFDEYMNIVGVCEQIYSNQHDYSCSDAKLHFTQFKNFPTVEELMEHHVEENFAKYFNFLVFYAEVFDDPSEEFKRTNQYLHQLFKKKLEIID